MLLNVQIDIEQFNNGIAYRWHDLNDKYADESFVSLEKSEANDIGKDIWSDIVNVLKSSGKNKIRLTIKYEALE